MNIQTSPFHSLSYRLKNCDYDKYIEIKLSECSLIVINKSNVLFEHFDRENYHFLFDANFTNEKTSSIIL